MIFLAKNKSYFYLHKKNNVILFTKLTTISRWKLLGHFIYFLQLSGYFDFIYTYVYIYIKHIPIHKLYGRPLWASHDTLFWLFCSVLLWYLLFFVFYFVYHCRAIVGPVTEQRQQSLYMQHDTRWLNNELIQKLVFLVGQNKAHALCCWTCAKQWNFQDKKLIY